MHTTANYNVRGSVLITAAILSSCLALFLVSYFSLSLFVYNQAQRNFLQNASLDLADAGLEDALWALQNNQVSATYGWTLAVDVDADGTDDDVYKVVTFASLNNGEDGRMTVAILNYVAGSAEYTIYAEGSCERGSEAPVRKQVRATAKRDSLFRYGVVGKDSVTLSGSSTVDSYDSDEGPYGTGAINYNGFVGTNGADNGDLNIANAVIKGGVATGGGSISYGGSAQIEADATTSYSGATVPYPQDFALAMPEITAPATAGAAGTYTNISVDTTLSAPGVYDITGGISINNQTLTLEGPGLFQLVVGGSISVGNGQIVLIDDASAEIYLAGGFAVGGGGEVNNGGSPLDCLIYGTSNTGVTYQFHGNTESSLAAYAPWANISLQGTDGLSGAVIGNAVTFNGNYAFHYDEALGTVPNANTFTVSGWKEMSQSDAGYLSTLGSL